MIKPIVQTEILKGWSVDPETYFGEYNRKVAIQIDPNRDPYWISDRELYKVALQAEPPSITKGSVDQYLSVSGKKYDLILTYYPSILSRFDNSKFLHFGGAWIRNIKESFNKEKMISFITSNKNFAVGHRLRMEIVNNINNRFDLYGRGFNEIETKDQGLDDYMFSISVENISMENYFTEKIIDCFLTKTVPIYYGCTNIGNFYDKRGIIRFNNLNELNTIIDNLSQDKYNELLPYIEYNYKKALSDLPYNKRVEISIKEEINSL